MGKPFTRILLWNDPDPRTPAAQMACDEVLLEWAGGPVLRTYRWSAPAATFGYSQRLGTVLALAGGRPVIRRRTGGGVVFHGDDLTLALAIPTGEALASWTSSEMYRAIHEALLPAIRVAAPGARLVAPEDCRCGAVCFESPVAHDVVEGARKLLGGAMRRSRAGILYQGSLQGEAPAPLELARALADSVENFSMADAVVEAARIPERNLYGTEAWRNLR
jgi:lipoyl(octanoyl) transferase